MAAPSTAEPTFTLTLRVRRAPDVVMTYGDLDTAFRVLAACEALPNNQITGWSLDEGCGS